MNKKYIFAVIAVIFIGISVMVSGYLIGEGIKSTQIAREKNRGNKYSILSMTEVAEYLNMTEAQVKLIIKIENKQLTDYGSFTGKMFPYFTVDDILYFYKDEIDLWLQDVTSNHRYYDTAKGFQIQ